MSSLSFSEKRRLEQLFRMESGYVLDFTNRTFREFFSDVVNVDIESKEYDYESGSKANRLRAFWNSASDAQTASVLEELIELAAASRGANKAEVGAARRIVARLRQDGMGAASRGRRGSREPAAAGNGDRTGPPAQVAYPTIQDPIEIFFSYAHEDESLMDDVRRQMVIHERNGRILKWHDRMIPPGAEWKREIDQRLLQARIIILFVSPHFIESRYCYEVEGAAALERHRAGDARVIPVILRPCDWQASPFGALNALPTDGRPISRWEDRDEACLATARGIMSVVDELTGGGP